MRKPENELSIYNIQAPQSLNYFLFDISQQAIRLTLQQLEGKVDGNTLTQIKGELLNSLKETFSTSNRNPLIEPPVQNYSFERTLSTFVMTSGRNLYSDLKQMLRDVNAQYIAGQDKVSIKKMLLELKKAYAKIFLQHDEQLKEKAAAIPQVTNLEEKSSINALFQKTLMDVAIQSYSEFSKTVKDDNIFKPTHPATPLYQQAREMLQQKKVSNTSIAASDFVSDYYSSMIAKAIGKYQEKLAEEFLNHDVKPQSYIEHKNQLNEFFKPFIEEALNMQDNDPEKRIRLDLLSEAQKEAGSIIESHYNKHHGLQAPSTSATTNPTINLDAMSSEPSSKRGSFRFKSPSSASSSRRGSMKLGSGERKGFLPDAFKIDPRKLEEIKAKRDQETKEEQTLKK